MTLEELEESIAWEAEQYIPFDIADVHLDVDILERREGQGQMDVLLVAAKKEIVDDYVNVVRETDRQPLVMDVEACALQRMYAYNYGDLMDEAVVLVDIGDSMTSINIVNQGMTTFTRDIAMAGQRFTQEIQRSLGITREEAVSYKEGATAGEHQDMVVPDEVERVINAVSDEIAVEIQKSLDFYTATTSEALFTKIYITGGSSRIPALSRTISRVCGVQVEPLNPFSQIGFDESKFSAETLEYYAPVAGVAVGLALRNTFEDGGINLLPVKQTRGRQSAQQQLSVAGVMVAGLLIGLGVFHNHQISKLDNAGAQVSQLNQAVEALRNEQAELNERRESLD